MLLIWEQSLVAPPLWFFLHIVWEIYGFISLRKHISSHALSSPILPRIVTSVRVRVICLAIYCVFLRNFLSLFGRYLLSLANTVSNCTNPSSKLRSSVFVSLLFYSRQWGLKSSATSFGLDFFASKGSSSSMFLNLDYVRLGWAQQLYAYKLFIFLHRNPLAGWLMMHSIFPLVDPYITVNASIDFIPNGNLHLGFISSL